MNLLTLQRCKKNAERMVADPKGWVGHNGLGRWQLQEIEEQGRRL